MKKRYPIGQLIPVLMWRWLLALLLWWILAEADTTGIPFALPFALLAALVSLPLLPPGPHVIWHQRVTGLLHFIPFFLYQSLLGGVDVARRAFHPHLPLAPHIIDYPLTLPAGWPRIVFLNTLSLLPGTLAVSQEGDRVQVHLLDARGDPHKALRQVEERVAGLFLHRKEAKDAKENN